VKIIALVALAAILLADVFGSKSSVGGPMTDLLVSVLIMLAVGIYESWSKVRGPLGWAVNIVLAVVGGVVALSLFGMAMEAAMTAIHFEGQLATSHRPLRYIADVAMPAFTILGSWLPLQVANRFALRPAH
jgi:hypothetical protein